MKNNTPQKQVSLAGAAKNKPAEPKKKSRVGLIVLASLLAVVVLAVAVSAIVKQAGKGPSLTAREMVSYTVTDDALAGKVTYLALGVLGANATDRLDMTAVLCFDRKADTVSVVQMPVATYIGSDRGFAVSTLGDVWGNPQEVMWCDSCRCAVISNQAENGKHTNCGSKLSTRKGSAFGDLCRVFNEQYGLPIDNYLVIPREGFIQLIDAVGGVDVQLDKNMTLGDVAYAAGVQLLPGKGAADYALMHEYKNTPATDRTRMLRQRQVFAGLLERLARYKVSELYYVDRNTGSTKGPIGQLMIGANPVRFDSSSFGKARLANCSESAAGDMKASRALAEFVADLAKVTPDKVTFSILPGESVKSGSASVWSVNRADVIALLGAQMNPYGLTLDANTVTAPQLKDKPAATDATTDTMDKVGVSQGTTTTTTATAAATTTTTVGGIA